MLGPSYAGNKMGDPRIRRIHHLITAEGSLSWKHSNLTLLIKAFLCALPTSSNRLLKRSFSFIQPSPGSVFSPFPYLPPTHLSTYDTKSKLNSQKVEPLLIFPSASLLEGGASDVIVHQILCNLVRATLWENSNTVNKGLCLEHCYFII